MEDTSTTNRRRRIRLIAVFSAVLVFAAAAAIGALLLRAPVTLTGSAASLTMELAYGSTDSDAAADIGAVTTGLGSCTGALVATSPSGELVISWTDVWNESTCLIGGIDGLKIMNTSTSQQIQAMGISDDGNGLVGRAGSGAPFVVSLVAPGTGFDQYSGSFPQDVQIQPVIPVGGEAYVNILLSVVGDDPNALPGASLSGNTIEIVVEPYVP